jgi:hypothetical protein
VGLVERSPSAGVHVSFYFGLILPIPVYLSSQACRKISHANTNPGPKPPKRTIEEARDLLLLLLPNEKNPNIDKYVLPHYIKASALIKIESKQIYMKQANSFQIRTHP